MDGVRKKLVAIVLLAAACSARGDRSPRASTVSATVTDSIARVRQDSINRTLPGYIVDSILPVAEELRRFREAVAPTAVDSLRGASTNRAELISRFFAAIAQNDALELERMALTPREFAWLVYPESPYTRPPYRQPPGLVWSQIQNPSRAGLTRLLRRLEGVPLRYVGSTCSERPNRIGRNRLWTRCLVEVADERGAVTRHRFFGSIIERKGLFKFVSYANDF